MNCTVTRLSNRHTGNTNATSLFVKRGARAAHCLAGHRLALEWPAPRADAGTLPVQLTDNPARMLRPSNAACQDDITNTGVRLSIDHPCRRRLLSAISMARSMAGWATFLTLTQSRQRPERWRLSRRWRRCPPVRACRLVGTPDLHRHRPGARTAWGPRLTSRSSASSRHRYPPMAPVVAVVHQLRSLSRGGPQELGTNPFLNKVYAKRLKVEHSADAWSGAAGPARLKSDQKLR